MAIRDICTYCSSADEHKCFTVADHKRTCKCYVKRFLV